MGGQAALFNRRGQSVTWKCMLEPRGCRWSIRSGSRHCVTYLPSNEPSTSSLSAGLGTLHDRLWGSTWFPGIVQYLCQLGEGLSGSSRAEHMQKTLHLCPKLFKEVPKVWKTDRKTRSLSTPKLEFESTPRSPLQVVTGGGNKWARDGHKRTTVT